MHEYGHAPESIKMAALDFVVVCCLLFLVGCAAYGLAEFAQWVGAYLTGVAKEFCR